MHRSRMREERPLPRGSMLLREPDTQRAVLSTSSCPYYI